MNDGNVLRRCAERNFNDLDTDGDGALTRNDYLALAERRCATAGVTVDSPIGRSVAEAYLSTWESHARSMDLDHDEHITKEEYVRSFESMVRSGTMSQVLAPMFRATFDLADRDGDGALAAEEFRTLWSRPGDDLAAAFQEADADGDGRITYEEYADVRRRLLVGEA
ncbi:EF-hand domain-containing protein [Nonomuraea sp. SBT364]|uniref:EF-hand domain-containing protein n=1 Tax=Nonomuraea sp. SBT364 TaxID=1580530 RepID=UPI00066AB152|nr:EF-hand domain-containing protein [Nonomuraea sp. SBT364]